MRPLALVLLTLGISTVALADWEPEDDIVIPPRFRLDGQAIGGAAPAPAAPAHLTASRIAAVGEGALAIDADTGALLLTRADGTLVARLDIGRDAGLLAYDAAAARAYIADRRGDRLVVARVGDGRLAQIAQWRTPAEPYAVALAPDGSEVLVATIADRLLIGYDARTGAERRRVPLASEPRGLTVSPDGARALVAYLATGFVDEVDLAGTVTHVALPALARIHARGAFAATFLGAHLAAVSFQRETPTPDPLREEAAGHYGGSFTPPITHHLAFLGARGVQVDAETEIHEPRALVWDGAHDALYEAGLGSEELVRIARASQLDPAATAIAFGRGEACGADGLAIAGERVLVWCSFSRSVIAIDKGKARRGAALVPSTLDADRHAGLVLFHTADRDVSGFGGMACGNCHLDGRADGMSWRIGGRDLQTPMLAGRLVGTAPFKWDGTAKDLPASLRQTVDRLGGRGLDRRQVRELVAYLESLPAVRVPTRPPTAIARGRLLFESPTLGCATCHDGEALTDRLVHRFGRDLASDTPSLVGLAASAPYFHDGSAATLEALLRERASVHGMAESARQLRDDEIADLVAFLETR